MSYLRVFNPNDELKEKIEDSKKSYTFPFPLDDFQEAGCTAIEKQENVLITAHTGSGKTVLALYGIGWCLQHNKKAIYTSPIKSLSNQKYYEFIQNFGMNTTIGIMTGDIKINSDAQIMIMTTEILRNLLYKDQQLDGIQGEKLINFDDVGVIIMDEVHYINDPDRGKVWEEVLLMSRPETTLIMLSATLDKPEKFGSWIGDIKQKPIHLIKTSHRVVPLQHYFLKDFDYEDEHGKKRTRWDFIKICDNHHKFQNYDRIKHKYKRHEIPSIMNMVIGRLQNDGYLPALFFRFSRKKCEEMCRQVKTVLLTHEELSQCIETFENTMLPYKKTYEHLGQYNDVYKQIQKGVAYHHSGMLPILKEVVEILFSRGYIKVLFATETFAIGVNMPTKTVLFSDLQKFDNNGLRYLRSDEYNQMAGRAGRRGLDTFGNVIILPTQNCPSEHQFKTLMSGASPILKSKFQINYQFVLKTLINREFNIQKYMNNTFLKQDDSIKKEKYLIENEKLEENINKMNVSSEINFKRIQEINEQLNDPYVKIKNKERQRLQNELKKLKDVPNYHEKEEKYFQVIKWKGEQSGLQEQVWVIDNEMDYIMNLMKNLLKKNNYIDDENNVMKKGYVASCICDVNELLLSETIIDGIMDDFEFEDIIGFISAFINEKDMKQDDKFVRHLQVSEKLKNGLYKLQKITEKYMDEENEHKINIKTDFDLYLDFIEPAYMWASGKTLKEIYMKVEIYEGNFVKSILRITNIMMNCKEIFQYLEKFDILKKIENYESILLRDEAAVNSIYVNGFA